MTREHALWAILILAAFLAVWASVKIIDHERRIDWDAPATDLDDVTPTEADRWDPDERPTPDVWSNASPGGWVCAAPADDMPGEICGWRKSHDPCPSHGRLIVPDGWTGGTR